MYDEPHSFAFTLWCSCWTSPECFILSFLWLEVTWKPAVLCTPVCLHVQTPARSGTASALRMWFSDVALSEWCLWVLPYYTGACLWPLLESERISTSCAGLVRRGRHSWGQAPLMHGVVDLVSLFFTSLRAESGVHGPRSLCRVSRTFRTAVAGNAAELIHRGASLQQGSLVTGA